MAFEIDPSLNPALMPLAWMIGCWQGNGNGNWPDQGDFEFGQQIEFASNGDSYLHYLSQTWTLDENGQPDKPLTMESGFWRPAGTGEVEVVLANPEGWAEVWAGPITGAKIQLTTDVVARTNSSTLEYTGGQRLYGNVEGDLMWTFDRASTDIAIQPYMWARLTRQ